MYLKDFIESFHGNRIKIFVDMDGVIVDYDFGNPQAYDIKRPLFSSIAKLEEISQMDNVELYILSVSRMDEGVGQKNQWLDKYAPFFKQENRVILPRESNAFMPAKLLKTNYLSNLERDGSNIIVIDDDPEILKEIHASNEDIILLKDTVLVD